METDERVKEFARHINQAAVYWRCKNNAIRSKAKYHIDRAFSLLTTLELFDLIEIEEDVMSNMKYLGLTLREIDEDTPQ